MAARVYLSMAYVAPRAVLWVLLFLVALIDGVRHRAVRSRGFQLFWALVGSVALFVVSELCVLIMAAQAHGQTVNRATLGAYIFFSDFASAYWFGILLLVAAGFCISRTTLGPHKPVVVSIPIIYLVSALVVDYVLYWIRGFDAFTDQASYYDAIPEETAERAGATTGFVFLICMLANTMAVLLAWFFIFDTIQKEKDILEQGHPDVSALPHTAQPGLPSRRSGPLPVSTSGAPPDHDDGGVGHAVQGGNAVLLDDAGGNASHLYVDVVEADLDAPKTFKDKVDEREKLRLIRRFFYGVCFYLVSTILVIFLPLFVPTVVDRTLLALQNAVLWLFAAALLWTFRMRQGSPYLMLDEAAEAADTGLVDGDREGPTTELGVMGHHDDNGHSGPHPGLGRQRFTLDDEDEEHGGLGRPQPSLNVSAAQQHGVFVEPLPTPQTPAPFALPR